MLSVWARVSLRVLVAVLCLVLVDTLKIENDTLEEDFAGGARGSGESAGWGWEGDARNGHANGRLCQIIPANARAPLHEFIEGKRGSKEINKCWCFQARPFDRLWAWGKTRMVQLDNYNDLTLQLWARNDETALVSAMSEQKESWLRFIPGMRSHSCSPFGDTKKCVVRQSPFESTCVGIKGRLDTDAILTVLDIYEMATLVPWLVAAAIFICAPLAAHSLWSYYLTASVFMSVCCIGVIVFFTANRFLGSKRQALFVGLLSWCGAVQQSVMHNLMFNKWAVLFTCTCALIGFLLAYNHPPNERNMFSVQVVLHFLAVVIVYFSVSLPETVAWFVLMGIVFLIRNLWRLRATSFVKPPHSGAASPGASGVQGGEGETEVSRHARLYSPRAYTPCVKTRLSEKRQIERQYRGPLNISEEENPFHTRGAAEYISQSQYEAQSNDMTQRALADLAQYVSSTEYLAEHADRLSTRARRGLARQIAFEKDFAMPPGYYDE